MTNPYYLSAARKRLLSDRRRLGTWRAVADLYQVNIAYVFNLAVHGKEPTNPEIRHVLGLRAAHCPICHHPIKRHVPPWVEHATQNLIMLEERKNK